MYDIALSVEACLRANTRTDIAWLVSSEFISTSNVIDAIAITQGGGRIGAVAKGIFDVQIQDVASRELSKGRITNLVVGPLEVSISDLPMNSTARFIIAPAHQFPSELWQILLQRKSVAIVVEHEDSVIKKIEIYSQENISTASSTIQELFLTGDSKVVELDGLVVTILRPIPKLIIAGMGPIANALKKNANLLGWQVKVDAQPENVKGLVANLSVIDSVVIMGHDLEQSSSNLASALESKAGYIGALGSRTMQENRANWLITFKEITDISRVHGPAGISIGASNPSEIALSILAEAVSVHKSRFRENP
jgi:xanthine dehydrogenase accessory factor